MNELIKVQTTKQGEQRVSARDLHKTLDSKKRFSDWWKQWGFKYIDGIDYFAGHSEVTTNQYGATKLMDDYFLTTETAKSISMLTDTQRGDEVRNYFIAVEKAFNSPEMMMARSLQYAESKMLNYESQIAEMKPKAIFADAVNVSHQTILVGDLAKLISQNGVQIGQNRLFGWLRDNGYLHKQGSQYNRPTQRYIDQGLFKVKESSHANPDGSVKLTFTTKVTGKGQQYFVNKFLNYLDVKEV
ncbi:phage-related antirepressor [Weissella oryzae SG25]|uniref:Phage-related antirepressor n=1 Tax=Weissella oryzae (strain DSM 25784 / JCM 18191 / LMG 30913 / SG25) TaxID=1329250 RepID=A0A069CTZ6_WEIOS|nr:phage antirepressor KilAC domain-containing protein [Weissella oryzae]GAK30703.1 phage-related antirepressor [Weissella oryzae SG25]